MLQRLERSKDIDFVIVHKLDRLARNRLDDVSITMAIQRAGATLVSCSENIDQTPQGRFMHAIMAGVAELYSANLGTEAIKGMRQKAKLGGTPGRAPIGYTNVIRSFEGRGVHTVEVDAERAEHVQWAFEQYATGEWTLSGLTAALEGRGLTAPKRPKTGGKPIVVAQLHRMLRNPYYTGIVPFEGVHYEGRHQAIISNELFEVVARVLEQKRTGERVTHRQHYLKGSVFCGRCGSRLGVSYSRGNGAVYPYFYCIARQKRSTCTMPYVTIDLVEHMVEEYWARVRPTNERIETISRKILEHVDVIRRLSGRELTKQRKRMAELELEERKLLAAHYAEAVSLALLREEQRRIARERSQAAQHEAVASIQVDSLTKAVDEVVGTLADGHKLYMAADAPQRRTMNRAVFERIWVDPGSVLGCNLSPGFAHISQHNLDDLLALEAEAIQSGHIDVESGTYERALTDSSIGDQVEGWLAESLAFSPSERPFGPLPAETTNPAAFRRQGSNSVLLAARTGFEPVPPP